MKRTLMLSALGAAVLLCAVAVFAKSLPRKATWHDFEGTWIGHDPGSGAFFHRLVLRPDKTGTCVVLLSEDVAWLYKVSVVTWDENWHLTLRFVPVMGTEDTPYEMERVDDAVMMTLREKGVTKPNRPREVQLMREATLKRNTARAEKVADGIK